MEFLKCPECKIVRVFVDGTCSYCGYCSSARASINALYTPKKRTQYEQHKVLRKLRRGK